MFSSKVIFALALFCVALVPAYGAVTSCHICSSPNQSVKDVSCIYANSTTSATTCGTGSFTHCVKQVKNEGEDNEQVIRQCGNETGFSCTSGYECFFCEDNDCNSSVTISQSIPIIGLTTVAAYLLSRFNY